VPRYSNGEYETTLNSWTSLMARNQNEKIFKENSERIKNIKVLLVKRIANFNDVIFKIKIIGNEEEITSITECIVNSCKMCFN